jgi:hypothetical protein
MVFEQPKSRVSARTMPLVINSEALAKRGLLVRRWSILGHTRWRNDRVRFSMITARQQP